MDLSDFIKSSLVQIVQGVSAAMVETQGDNRAHINPSATNAAYTPVSQVNFDVAVTIAETGSVKGKGSIAVFSGSAAVDGEKKATNSSVSRISFSIPVALPSKAVDQYPSSGGGGRARRAIGADDY